MQEILNDYDSEPVSYCPNCYSLQIGYIDGVDNSDYCMHCGCSEVKQTSIAEWEKLYQRRYGHKFVEKNPDIRRTKVYNMTLKELKQEVYDSPFRMDIINQMYPNSTEGLTKAETVILLFDRAIRDNRLKELRELLIEKHA